MPLYPCQNVACQGHVNSARDQIGPDSFRCGSCGHVQRIPGIEGQTSKELAALNTSLVTIQCPRGGKAHQFAVPVDPSKPHYGVDLEGSVKCNCEMELPPEIHTRTIQEWVEDENGRRVQSYRTIEEERIPIGYGSHTYAELLQTGDRLQATAYRVY